MNQYTLEIKGTLPTLNEMINNSKAHRMKYVTMKEKALQLVGWSARQQLGGIKLSHADYHILWICPNRKKDKDNVTAGQKYIFDGLQEVGILVNDGWKQIGKVSHDFDVDSDNPRIIVTIKEVKPYEQAERVEPAVQQGPPSGVRRPKQSVQGSRATLRGTANVRKAFRGS